MATMGEVPSLEDISVPTVITTSTRSVESEAASTTSPIHISLGETETQFFEALLETAAAFNAGDILLPAELSTTDSSSPLEFRVAGGWVRDKILGLSTHDIDIGVNCLTGVQAATLLQIYLKSPHGQKFTWTGHTSVRVGVIAANPQQSKHLETATMMVGGLDIDFANLRSQEIYAADSRIPTVQMGTPLDDAIRRDFTLNALFYNLHTKCIEDWTRRGLSDLRAGQLVTPLDAKQTFYDDPLRVLRAIRFAVRLGFKLHSSIEEAAMDPQLHHSLHVKISRERVGKELEGMLSGKGANPTLAVDTIARLLLAPSVFLLPRIGEAHVVSLSGTILGESYAMADNSKLDLVSQAWNEGRSMLQILSGVSEAHALVSSELRPVSAVDSRLVSMASFLLPFRKLFYEEKKKVGRQFLAVSYIIRDGIKFKTKDVQAVTTMMETVDSMASLLTDMAVEKLNALCRLDAGLFLRQTKDLWVTCLLLATVVKVRQAQQGQDGCNGTVDWIQVSVAAYRSIIGEALDECWKTRPLLDGKAIIAALNLPRGPVVGTYLDEQMRWMLLHPNGTREECESHLRTIKQHLDAETEKGARSLEESSSTSNNARQTKRQHVS